MIGKCCAGWFAWNALVSALIAGWMLTLVEEPPAEMAPSPRPAGELFFELPGGARMPMNGFGTCCRRTALWEPVRRSVLWYLLSGGRHIDGATTYFNHFHVGAGISQAIARGVPREEIFLTSKIYPPWFSTDYAEKFVHSSLWELGVEYLDLVLLHSAGTVTWGTAMTKVPSSCATPRLCREEAWRVLSKYREQGLIKNLGVSNFGPRQIGEIMALNGTAPVTVNQIEFNPWIPEVHRKTVEFCHRHGIAVTAYCALGGWENATTLKRQAFLQDIGRGHGKTALQVLLRWALQKNVSVIPGSGNPKHIRENLAVYDFELSATEMARIEAARTDDGEMLHRARSTGVPDGLA